MNTKMSHVKNQETITDIIDEGLNSSAVKSFNMLEVVEDVEIRLIQEELKEEQDKLIKEFSSFMSREGFRGWSNRKKIGLGLVSVPILALVPLVACYILAGPFVMMFGINSFSLMCLGISMHLSDVEQKENRLKTEIKERINKLQLELVEKSLKAYIVNNYYDTKFSDEWNDFYVSRDNGKTAVRVSLRLVKDESTGFERVEVRNV